MDLLRKFRDWFISGLAFSIAVLLVTLAWQTRLKELVLPEPSYTVHNPTEIEVVALEPVSITNSAGVTATLKNTSTTAHYKPSSYELVFLLGEKRLGSCDVYEERPDLLPGATGQIQALCPEIERTALPTGVSYKLTVRRAWRIL